MKPYVLIVEDEPSIVEMLRYNLESAEFETEVARDGDEGLVALAERQPDIVLLDWMLPGISGIEVCRQIRRRRETRNLPVIILTARGEEADRVRGLDSGADDYVTKPFSPSELIARVRAVMRRAKPSSDAEALTFADLTMDVASREVLRGSRSIELTRTEFALLEMFLRRPRRVLERAFILEEVWGYDFPTTANSLEVYVGYLRRKTEAEGEPRLLHTVRGVGYVLKES
jgi:two-component system response regulator MprA